MTDDLTLRPPTVHDGAAMWRLAAATKVLDVNSAYAYVLWCRDFAASSIVAEATPATGGEPTLAGFVTGYRRPTRTDSLFVWQVAVDDRFRRQGIAVRQLRGLVERLRPDGVAWVEATVAPSNRASLGLFRSLGRELDAPCAYPSPGGFVTDELPEPHEPEPLLRIGPF